MKRRNPFDDEEGDSSVEEHPRRSHHFFEHLVNNENLVSDAISTNTSDDYKKLNERYADLEVKYGQAMSQIAIFEQTTYENELFVNRITEDRDAAEAEKERAQKKAADIELLNKDLGNDVIEYQSTIEKMKKDKLDLEERINGLQNELENEKKNFEKEKSLFDDERKVAHEKIISLQKELTDLKNAAEEKSNEENSKLFAKIDNLENQLEQERISAVQERENYMNEYESIEAAHKRLITEKEGLQKQLENLQECSNAKIAELEESVINRAKEMFNEWKKEKIIKKKKREAESKETAVKNEDREMKDDEMQNQYEPKWMFVSKAECLDIYNSNHDKIKNFLQQYYSRLFNHVELMLSEEKMNKEKLAEAQAVVLWFWSPENDAQKELVITAAKKKLNERRSNARAQAYKNCTNDRSVAYTSDGKEFYYSLRKCGTWKPVADKECKRIKKFRRTHHSSFGIPSEYASSEYILIVQDSSEEGQKIHKMLPSSGYIECIFKKAGHEKKSPK